MGTQTDDMIHPHGAQMEPDNELAIKLTKEEMQEIISEELDSKIVRTILDQELDDAWDTHTVTSSQYLQEGMKLKTCRYI